jgi:anti-sigma B factor antagonist
MTIEKVLKDSCLTVTVAGRLDTSTAPELDAALKDSLFGTSEVDFDFKDLEYMSSAGLRLLLATSKKVGTVKLLHLNDTVKEVLDITGFSSLFEIVA